MRFARFGITLERLERDDLEIVRQWRNSAWVRPNMRYQRLVEPNDQRKWFENLDPQRDWYFVARRESAPFALFHIKDIDWNLLTGESGGFVGEPTFIGHPWPALATLALMDFGFLVLRLAALQARYGASLPRVRQFNQQLGYRVTREDDDGFLFAQVTAEDYLERAAPWREAAVSMHGVDAILSSPDPWLLMHIRDSAGSPAQDLQLRVS